MGTIAGFTLGIVVGVAAGVAATYIVGVAMTDHALAKLERAELGVA